MPGDPSRMSWNDHQPSQSLGRKVHQAFQVLAFQGWGNESEQKAEKEPRMGKSLLILFPLSFLSPAYLSPSCRPHSSKKESKRMVDPCSLNVWVCGRGRWALKIYKILDLHQNNRVLKVHTRSRGMCPATRVWLCTETCFWVPGYPVFHIAALHHVYPHSNSYEGDIYSLAIKSPSKWKMHLPFKSSPGSKLLGLI